MKVLEFEAKALLSNQNIPTPTGQMVTTPAEAAAVAHTLGRPVVLKAQIPTGGRMKAGGVYFADNSAEAQTAAQGLLGVEIKGYRVEQVLIEPKLEIAAELFISFTYDAELRRPVMLASSAGGIEVETAIHLIRRPFSVLLPLPDYLGREIAAELGFEGQQLLQLGKLITQIGRCFTRWEALLLEINPLALDSAGRWWVTDVHLELDDDAALRQPDLVAQLPHSRRWAEAQSAFERQAAEIDRADHRGVAGRLVPFEGNLGLLIGGGGASLAIFDAVLEAGLKPANYCEIGGNPSVWKTTELTKLILSQPQVERLAVIMNVVSNTRADLVARGVIKGVLELGRDPQAVIAAFRVPGSWEDEGQAILRHYGLPFFGRETSLDQVVAAIKEQGR
jgi:succinyl-CoA synthetase beta subunit/citryl-CoA synthetase large subunit